MALLRTVDSICALDFRLTPNFLLLLLFIHIFLLSLTYMLSALNVVHSSLPVIITVYSSLPALTLFMSRSSFRITDKQREAFIVKQ